MKKIRINKDFVVKDVSGASVLISTISDNSGLFETQVGTSCRGGDAGHGARGFISLKSTAGCFDLIVRNDKGEEVAKFDGSSCQSCCFEFAFLGSWEEEVIINHLKAMPKVYKRLDNAIAAVRQIEKENEHYN